MTHSIQEKHTIFNNLIHTDGSAVSDGDLVVLESVSDALEVTETLIIDFYDLIQLNGLL